MRLQTPLLALLFAMRVFAAPQPPNSAALPVAHYDLAELVFRQYVSADAKCVFHLSYGTNDAVLPADFIARFKGQSPLVRSLPDGVIVVSNRFVLDKITRKQAVGLGIRQLHVTGDTAEVQVVYFASGTSTSTRYYLVRERNGWRVKDKKMEWIACGG
jgi:hypothetical protein